MSTKRTRVRAGLVDATGAVRRLQALVAIGHPQTTLASRLGVKPPFVSILIHARHEHVSVQTHWAVAKLYSELWTHPVEGREGDRPRAIAQANGWVSPLAWDDIDDPKGRPNLRGVTAERKAGKGYVDEIAVERAMRGERVKLTHPERQEAIKRLHARRWSDMRIGRALRISERTVLRNRQDMKLEAFDQSEIRKVNSA
ncbi:hypothetical protein ACFVU2_19730 [Leifsonia sp. NPDC058194]|uniref:hypothetical protein n=1 Tax=Leifsonia sp. NPDC058194 TaxID=3346374 RepID=UPI0036DBF285